VTLGSDDLINIPLPAKLIRCVLKDAPRHGATPREGDFGGRGRGGGGSGVEDATRSNEDACDSLWSRDGVEAYVRSQVVAS